MLAEIEDFAEVVVSTIKSALQPVSARIAAFEQRLGIAEQLKAIPGPAGRDGRDGARGEKGEPGAQGEIGSTGSPGAAGKDADTTLVEALQAEIVTLRVELSQMKAAAEQVDTQALIDAAVTKAFAALPVPKDGVGISKVEVAGEWLVVSLSDATVIHAGKVVGKDVDMADVNTLVDSSVQKAVAALPVPKDGRSVTVEDVAPLIGAEVAKAIASLPAPKDGVGLTGALVDRSGHLVVTLSDGTSKDVGLVIGKDADLADVHRAVVDEVAKIPRPKDGEPGKDGRDGSLDNIKLVQVDERTWEWQFKNGDPVDGGLMKFAGAVLDRGVFDSARAYESGDGVTYSGSFWVAKADSQGQQPGTNVGAPFWRLAVKRGADGKPGAQGTKGLDGKDGQPGKDGNRY